MKNVILLALSVASLGIISCSNSSGNSSGSSDFSSLTPNATYDNVNFSAYSRVKLDANLNAFTRYEVREIDGVQTECTVQGTWTLMSGEDSPATGNAVQVTGATVNGTAVADIIYPVGQLTEQALNIQLGADATSTDLANSTLTSYPDFQSLNPNSLPKVDFCKEP